MLYVHTRSRCNFGCLPCAISNVGTSTIVVMTPLLVLAHPKRLYGSLSCVPGCAVDSPAQKRLVVSWILNDDTKRGVSRHARDHHLLAESICATHQCMNWPSSMSSCICHPGMWADTHVLGSWVIPSTRAPFAVGAPGHTTVLHTGCLAST